MQKQGYIVYLRVIATFLVIAIHASTGLLNLFAVDRWDWHYANILHSSSRFCVPLFVMISGALLLQKDEPIHTFYRKRLLRIGWPFLFWIPIYLIYYFYRYTDFASLGYTEVLRISADKILHSPSAHLWYLYMLIGLYATIPFLRKIVSQVSDKELKIFLTLWFASLLVTNKMLFPYVPKIDLTFFSGYIGYLILGYYLSIKNITIPQWVLILCFIGCAAATTAATFYLSHAQGSYQPLWYGYLFPNNALMASFVFLLFKNASSKLPIPQWVAAIDRHSFGIYLIHILVLNTIHPLIHWPPLWHIPTVSILTLALSAILIYGLRQIPYLQKFTG